MPISPWNRAEKAEFFRRYIEAFFPLLEGDHPLEAIVAPCRKFLGNLNRDASPGLAEAGQIPAPAGLFLIEDNPEEPEAEQALKRFFRSALSEKLCQMAPRTELE